MGQLLKLWTIIFTKELFSKKNKVQIAACVPIKAVDKFLPKLVYWGFKVSTINW